MQMRMMRSRMRPRVEGMTQSWMVHLPISWSEFSAEQHSRKEQLSSVPSHLSPLGWTNSLTWNRTFLMPVELLVDT